MHTYTHIIIIICMHLCMHVWQMVSLSYLPPWPVILTHVNSQAMHACIALHEWQTKERFHRIQSFFSLPLKGQSKQASKQCIIYTLIDCNKTRIILLSHPQFWSFFFVGWNCSFIPYALKRIWTTTKKKQKQHPLLESMSMCVCVCVCVCVSVGR
jgi:hypothetical protein